jgi:hypothetical protein
MGGPGAPDNLAEGAITQAWLAVSDEPAAVVTAGHFFHRHPREVHPAARDASLQEALLAYCAERSGVPFPAPDEPRYQTNGTSR